MQDHIRRKLDKFERQDAFMLENAADFPVGSPGNAAAVINRAIVGEMRSLAAQQMSSGSSAAAAVGNKQEELDELWELMRRMNRAANAFGDEVPGSELQFRLPRNRSEQNILAAAHAFHTDSQPLQAKFVEYGLPASFRNELQAALAGIEEHSGQNGVHVSQRAGATGGLADAAQRGMTNSRKLDAIVRIKYAANASKLAAWTVASHLDAAPKRNLSGNGAQTPAPAV